MNILQIWKDGQGDWSFMRVALTPALLACIFGIVYGVISLNPATIGASVSGIVGMLFAKSNQAKHELKEQSTSTVVINKEKKSNET